MGKLIGIDLGTTNSAVAYVGDVGRFKKYGSVAVVEDEFGRQIHASAICECDGELVFGDDAKVKAAEGFAPHRFWKRYMGKGITYPLRGKDVLPQDLSRLLLEYLKGVAERGLGDKVEAAVITHLAYFGADAIAATRQAADEAGLNVGRDRLMMEPIAAALAYLHVLSHAGPDGAGRAAGGDGSDRLRVMVYDLGGGTFDITLLDRGDGEFTPLAFGGDPELGGYNFDKAPANHILQHLRGQGYAIAIDPDHPERDVRWARLMALAEDVKCALSKDGPAGLKKDVREPRVFTDDAGKSVQLNLTVTRAKFEEMIRPLVDRTIKLCKDVLAGKNLAVGQVDRAILVGGSTRAPLVRRRLAEEFGREFEFDEEQVDLCVAIGAALAAAGGRVVAGGFRMDAVPAETAAADLAVSGRVLPTDAVPDVKGSAVTLDHDGTEADLVVGADGKFFFRVGLNPDAVNELVLTAASPAGEAFARHAFAVRHHPEAADDRADDQIRIQNYLAKGLYVETEDEGLVMIQDEGPVLPLVIKVDWLVTGAPAQDGTAEVVVKLYQEDQHLVEIPLRLGDASARVPAGTPVLVKVKVDKDYAMHATAEIVAAGVRNEAKNIAMPATPRPDVKGLMARFEKLRGRYREFLEYVPPGEERLNLGAEADQIMAEVEDGLLKDAEKGVFRIDRLLRKLERLMKQYAADYFRPSRQEFDDLVAEARRLLPEAEARDPALRQQQVGRTIDDLKAQADAAYARRDRGRWSNAAKRLGEVVDGLKPPAPARPLPPPPMLAMMTRQYVAELEQTGAQQPDRAAAVRAAAQRVRADLDNINVNDPAAGDRLRGVIGGPLQDLIRLAEGTAAGGGAGTMIGLRRMADRAEHPRPPRG